MVRPSAHRQNDTPSDKNTSPASNRAHPAIMAARPISALFPNHHCPNSGPIIGSRYPVAMAPSPYQNNGTANTEAIARVSAVCAHVGNSSSCRESHFMCLDIKSKYQEYHEAIIFSGQHDIAAQLRQIAVAIHHKRLESPLEHMAHAPMTPVEALRIDALHGQ